MLSALRRRWGSTPVAPRSVAPEAPDPPTVRFGDPTLDRTFAEQGFVTVPLLDDASVALLDERWQEIGRDHPPRFDPTGLATTVRHPGLDELADSAITPLVAAALEGVVLTHVPFMSAYLVKSADATDLPAHLDWRLVDESIAPTLGCWIPLCAVDESNGGLGLVPGSHLLVDFDRTPEDPGHEWVHTDGADLERFVVDLPAGTAVIYDHCLVHFSPPVQHGGQRVATNTGLATPEAAEQARSRLLDMMRRGMSGSGGGPQLRD